MRHYAKALLVTSQSASSVAVGSGVSRLTECRIRIECRLRISLRWHCDTLAGLRSPCGPKPNTSKQSPMS